MSDDALSVTVAKVVHAANTHVGRGFTQPFRDALNALVALDGPEAEQKRARVAAALRRVQSPSGAGLIAVWLGAGVEHGADPSPEVQPLLDCLLRFTRQVRTGDGDFREDEVDDALAVGLEYLGQGLVSHLSRDLGSLRALQGNTAAVAELERVESYSSGPMWVLELIRKVSGSLVVLHGEELVGVRVEYRNISNCFHLFTLLQAALEDCMPGARKVSAGVLAAARGEHSAEWSDEAWWHYGQPASGSPELMTSVFGEQSPQEIGSVHGQQVLLLWPPLLGSRAWDAGFFGPALDSAPADVELIEALSAEDVSLWRDRIGLPGIR